jgi:hypothetical protein
MILARRHPDRPVEPDDLAVEHLVLDDVFDEIGVLLGPAEPWGKGTCLPKELRASSGRPAIIGVSKMPGAMVMTRIPLFASSRATGRVRATTPPLDAA